MPNKVTPEELGQQPDELNLPLHRNDKLVKNALRQLEYDGRIPPETKPVYNAEILNEMRRSLKKRSRDAQQVKVEYREERGDQWKVEQMYNLSNETNDANKVDIKGENKEALQSQEQKAGGNDGMSGQKDGKLNVEGGQGGTDSDNKNVVHYQPSRGLKPKTVPSVEELSVTRVDAVVFIVVFAQLVGCLAVGFEMYAYALDQKWNKVLHGDDKLNEIDGHSIFKGKTLNLQGHDYLKKAREYATREEPEELIFIIFMLVFIIASIVQIWTCYIKAIDVEQYTLLLIALYAFGGAMCIYSSTFLVSAAVNIENGFTYAADMLYNFRLIDRSEDIGSGEQGICHTNQFRNGCDNFEFAKLQSFYLEKIFRYCGSGSRFTRYYRTDTIDHTIQIFDETYFRSDLKQLGFCSRDGFKYAAAACALLMGMLCSIVPVIFCCEGSVGTKKKWIDSTDIVNEFRRYVQKDSSGQDDDSPDDSIYSVDVQAPAAKK